MKTMTIWLPAALFALGAVFTVGVDVQQRLDLRVPLDSAIATRMVGHRAHTVEISQAELEVAGVTTHLARAYRLPDSTEQAVGFTLYIGYYDSQTEGRTIHSPKNCLPGAGWEPLASQVATVGTATGDVPVNRYLLQSGTDQALVLYWYQGRGRVAANEYLVKWDLLRDAALKRRTEEALVRIVVPIGTTEQDAFELAAAVAEQVIGELAEALPAT